MSHVAKVSIEIRSLDALKAACERLGLEFIEGETSFNYFSNRREKCQHAIRVRGNVHAHEMGVIQNPPGTIQNIRMEDGALASRDVGGSYTLLWDPHSGRRELSTIVGNSCNTLRQMYAIEAAKLECPAGFQMYENVLADGTIELEMVEQMQIGAGW